MTLELRVKEILGSHLGRPLSTIADDTPLAELLPSPIFCQEVRDELEEAFQVPLAVADLDRAAATVGDVVRLLAMITGG